MNRSRLDTQQQNKHNRQRKRNKMIRTQLLLLALIIVAGGGLLLVTQTELLTNWPRDEQQQESGLLPLDSNDSGAADNEGTEELLGAQDESNSGNNSQTGQEDGLDRDNSSNSGLADADGGAGSKEAEAVTLVEDSLNQAETLDGRLHEEEKIQLSFVGDVLINEYVSSVTELEGYEYLFQKALFHLSQPDLTAGNLEYPVTTRGVPVKDTKYVFKGAPETLPAIAGAGFDVMSLANNHALDQGVEGLRDTMQHLDDAGLAYMGAGNNDTEAFAPVIKEVKGIKVAYVGLSRVIPFVEWKADKNTAGVAESYDTRRAVAAITKAKEQADIVVVMVHWGEERVDKPVQHQFDYGKQYIDAGADLVIGSHPHVLQGFEQYKGKWIAYSLGNFIFSTNPKDAGAETGVLDASCTKQGDCELQFYPMTTIKAQPTPLEGEAARTLLNRLTSISYGVRLMENGTLAAN